MGVLPTALLMSWSAPSHHGAEGIRGARAGGKAGASRARARRDGREHPPAVGPVAAEGVEALRLVLVQPATSSMRAVAEARAATQLRPHRRAQVHVGLVARFAGTMNAESARPTRDRPRSSMAPMHGPMAATIPPPTPTPTRSPKQLHPRRDDSRLDSRAIRRGSPPRRRSPRRATSTGTQSATRTPTATGAAPARPITASRLLARRPRRPRTALAPVHLLRPARFAARRRAQRASSRVRRRRAWERRGETRRRVSRTEREQRPRRRMMPRASS